MDTGPGSEGLDGGGVGVGVGANVGGGVGVKATLKERLIAADTESRKTDGSMVTVRGAFSTVPERVRVKVLSLLLNTAESGDVPKFRVVELVTI